MQSKDCRVISNYCSKVEAFQGVITALGSRGQHQHSVEASFCSLSHSDTG